MGTRIGIAEFLENVSKLKTNQEKVNALKANDSLVLRTILQSAFDPNIKWLLPDENPPFKPNTLVDLENVLISEIRKIKYFVEGFYPNLKDLQRQRMFIELLEAVDKKDAELLLSIKSKKLPYKGITSAIVTEGLPGIF